MDEKFQNLPLRSGVGIVILNKENKIFVAKRIDNPKNFWQMPQGGVDKDEDFLSAAYRELEEETSIKDVELIREIDEIYLITKGSTSFFSIENFIQLKRQMAMPINPKINSGSVNIYCSELK